MATLERAGAVTSADLCERFRAAVDRILPRVLTQANRDPGSPSYGCFDRNWWHYKIRDFPSVILQQGAYAMAEAAKLQSERAHRAGVEEAESLQTLARAGAEFWQSRARRRGAFEEYYPWEQGYPPLAFATLAVGKLVADGVVPLESVAAGLRVAARQLVSRFEERAGNQQVAGLAALAVLRQVEPTLAPEARFEELAERTLALQHEEGWYVEYDGPDLGYLAVTLDCLWDLHDVTGQKRFRTSAVRALRFLARVVAVRGASAGMLNARNTDYLVPYGLLRFALEDGDERRLAGGVVAALYRDVDRPEHFLSAIDDRYLCHYVGHSFIRGLLLLEAGGESEFDSAALDDGTTGEAVHLPGCGYLLHRVDGRGVLVAAKKGGVFAWGSGAHSAADFGWQVEDGESVSFNHWWSLEWEVSVDAPAGRVEISGKLYSHRAAASSPFKHFVLRVLSFTLGSRLIGWLKSKLIFKNARGTIEWRRCISLRKDEIVVEDVFENLPAGCEVKRAPRASKRHVSSADSYHPEDLVLCRGVARSERREGGGDRLAIESTYALASSQPGS